tara:strand:+ start:35277 stop:35975 length:699 start_codon:yes stop_codon:yes gene_type:complete
MKDWSRQVMSIQTLSLVALAVAIAGCKSTNNRIFIDLRNGLTTPDTNWRDQFEICVDEYTFEYRFYSADESFTATYGNLFAVAAVLSYSTPGHLFNDMKPDEFVQDVESVALSIRNQPILSRAEKVDRTFHSPERNSALDEKLNWLARTHIIGEAAIPAATPGYLYQCDGSAHLVVTRILSTGEIHKINYVLVDDDSKVLMSASLMFPRRVSLEASLINHAHDLVWRTLASH